MPHDVLKLNVIPALCREGIVAENSFRGKVAENSLRGKVAENSCRMSHSKIIMISLWIILENCTKTG